MRAITRLNVPSVLKLFAVFYALVGLYAASKGAITGIESIEAPFGLAFPLCWAYVKVHFHLPQPASAFSFVMVFGAVVFYATTGLLSGAVVVLAYNLIAPHVPLLLGQLQQEEPIPPAAIAASHARPDATPTEADSIDQPSSPML